MDLRKRLTRRPVTTVLWTVVATVMALLIGVGGTLMFASGELYTILDSRHTTIATQKQRIEQVGDTTWRHWPATLFPSDVETLEKMDMVEMVDLRTLTGAYIPELTSRLGLRPWGDICAIDVDEYWEWGANDAYKNVVMVGTVERAWFSKYEDCYDYDLSQVGGAEFAETRYMNALLSIEAVLAGHPDNYYFPNDTFKGYNGKVIINVPVYCSGEENFFEVGQRYIFQGQYDQSVYLWDADMSQMGLKESPHLKVAWTYAANGTNCFAEGDTLVSHNDYEATSNVSKFDVSMSNRGVLSFQKLSEEVTPIAQKLDESVEEFLNDSKNAQWVEMVERYGQIIQSFPVLGTEALESMYVFVKNEASIVEGRSFTQEEYDGGEKVCVISQSVANAAGIKVGDNLSFSQFLCGKNYGEGNHSVDVGTNGFLNNPSIGFRTLENGFVTENETFTVVGIYSLNTEWVNSEYSITPNTVFVPQKAQIEGGFGGVSYTEQVMENVRYEYADGRVEDKQEMNVVTVDNGVIGVYNSIVLKNGSMEAFMEAIKKTTLNERVFLTFDQGYEAAQESVDAVVETAQKLLYGAAAGWILLLLLYVLLYQSFQRRNLGIMRSVGAKPGQARRYLFASGLLPAAVGFAAGTLASGYVVQLVQGRMVELTLAEIPYNPFSNGTPLDAGQLTDMLSQTQMPVWNMLLMAAAQIAIASAMLWVHAALMSGRKPRRLLGV